MHMSPRPTSHAYESYEGRAVHFCTTAAYVQLEAPIIMEDHHGTIIMHQHQHSACLNQSMDMFPTAAAA